MAPFPKMIEQLDYEVMWYEKLPLPAGSDYIPIEDTKPVRRGCEHEYSTRSNAGDPFEYNLSKEERIISMPESMLKPIDLPISSVICPHPTLKSLFHYQKYTEVNLEFSLWPRELPKKPWVDEISIMTDTTLDDEARFLNTQNLSLNNWHLPGNVGIRTI